MGRRRWGALALVTAVIGLGAACAPLPTPNDALVVTTTADTFDGVCDAECSLRDAVAAANELEQVGELPNPITLPADTVVVSGTEPIVVTRSVEISGVGSGLSVLDITDAQIAGGAGVFDVRAFTSLSSVDVVSSDPSTTDVLASCTAAGPQVFNLFSANTDGLAATSSGCDATIISSVVTGPATVIAPNRLAATSSTLPFADTTLTPLGFVAIGSILTGPTTSGGTTAPATLDLQAPPGVDVIDVNLTASKVVGLDLRLGGDGAGSVNAGALSSSFALNGTGGPTTITVGTGSTATFINSSVHGGGPAGALAVEGTLNLESATITTSGPAIVPGTSGVVNARRSILGASAGATCTAAVTSQGYNVVVGSSCGTPAGTDVVVADEAALQLGAVESLGGLASQHRVPGATSPAVDLIPPGPGDSADCPTEFGQGRSIDALGTLRPIGSGCDAGAIEFVPAPPPAT
jgi:CSLREA domain-containing protein